MKTMKTNARNLSRLCLGVLFFAAALPNPEARAENTNRTNGEEMIYAGVKGALGTAGILYGSKYNRAAAALDKEVNRAETAVEAAKKLPNSPAAAALLEKANARKATALQQEARFWNTPKGNLNLRYAGLIGGMILLFDGAGHVLVAFQRWAGTPERLIIHPLSVKVLLADDLSQLSPGERAALSSELKTVKGSAELANKNIGGKVLTDNRERNGR